MIRPGLKLDIFWSQINLRVKLLGGWEHAALPPAAFPPQLDMTEWIHVYEDKNILSRILQQHGDNLLIIWGQTHGFPLKTKLV
jgi:hypothetical protein